MHIHTYLPTICRFNFHVCTDKKSCALVLPSLTYIHMYISLQCVCIFVCLQLTAQISRPRTVFVARLHWKGHQLFPPCCCFANNVRVFCLPLLFFSIYSLSMIRKLVLAKQFLIATNWGKSKVDCGCVCYYCVPLLRCSGWVGMLSVRETCVRETYTKTCTHIHKHTDVRALSAVLCCFACWCLVRVWVCVCLWEQNVNMRHPSLLRYISVCMCVCCSQRCSLLLLLWCWTSLVKIYRVKR